MQASTQEATRWAVILGCSTGTGAAIARALAVDPGLNVFGVHRGHYAKEADLLVEELRTSKRQVHFHVGDAGRAESARECAAILSEIAGPGSVRCAVHALSGASLGHFLDTHGDGFLPRQFEKTFDYLAHSFAYWGRLLHEMNLLAPNARLLGLTNLLHDSLVENCGLIAAAKAALQVYVRHLALELGPLGHRVNLLKFGTAVTPALTSVLGPEGMARLERQNQKLIPAGRSCTLEEVGRLASYLARDESDWFNGATIDFTGGMTLKLLDLVQKEC